MGFWGYAIMLGLTFLGIAFGLANRKGSKSLLGLSTCTIMINGLIALCVLVPMTIMMLVYRLSHSGKVCSGDYRFEQRLGDYD
jgi:uncharacterized membrane protein YhaH (DUF805 family)